jgi:hypothetical protein
VKRFLLLPAARPPADAFAAPIPVSQFKMLERTALRLGHQRVINDNAGVRTQMRGHLIRYHGAGRLPAFRE